MITNDQEMISICISRSSGGFIRFKYFLKRFYASKVKNQIRQQVPVAARDVLQHALGRCKKGEVKGKNKMQPTITLMLTIQLGLSARRDTQTQYY